MSAVLPLYRVLFVCAGNTCRSPMAVAALSEALGEEGQRVAISSAGVLAADDAPASAHAVEVAGRRGLDLSAHRARRLTAAQLAEADLVLAMDGTQLGAVRRMSPEAASRSHVSSDFGAGAPAGVGVPDPFGGSVEAYEECLRRIVEHVERIAPIILHEVQARAEAEPASRDKGVV